MKFDEINKKQSYFANLVREAMGSKLTEFLEKMVKSIKDDNPNVDPEFLENQMWFFIDCLQSEAFYNIGAGTYNRLSREGFWGQCEPTECIACGQSCKMPQEEEKC